MIEQTAVVLRLDGRFALVQVQRQSSCGQCNAKQGCGTGLLEASLGRRSMQIKAENRCDAKPGDEVVVAIPETGFVKSAFLTYLLPLLLMLVGALLAQQLFAQAGDLVSILGAAIGFGGALLILRLYSRKLEREKRHQPVVTRKAQPPVSVEFRTIHNEQQPF